MSNTNQPLQRRPKGLVWLLFYAPGTFILWLNYYFPKNGEVWVSARRRGNPTMELLYSLAFWVVIAGLAWMIFSPGPNH